MNRLVEKDGNEVKFVFNILAARGPISMQLPPWLQPRSDPRKDALVLGMLNLVLALTCAVTFFGVLAIAVLSSEWLRSSTGNPTASVPFPVPVLLLIYVAAFVVT